MSRQFDESRFHVPDELSWEDYFYDGKRQYMRIRDYPDYFITDDGIVISMLKERPINLRTWENAHGHQYVQLSNGRGSDRDKVLVHRLVAEAFIPNPHDYPIVRHLNDVPYDNCVSNLAWGTAKDNRDDSIRNGNDFRKGVYCFETDRVYRSGADAAREFGLAKSQITRCCQGKSGNAGGYHFCFEDEMEEKKKDPRWLRDRALKPIVAYGPDGEVLRFNSRKEAAKTIGIPECGISSVVNGHLKHTHKWRFEEG